MTENRNAQALLQWGIRNTPGASSEAPGEDATTAQITSDILSGKRPDLADPGLYDAIMGKSEAQMMREELTVAVDETRSVDDRCTALDNFEMLIESIDNANNMANMKMWQPIIALLHSAEPRIQTAAAWIVGTAVQNNDKAQVAILDHAPLAPLLELLNSTDTETRSKTMYALSGLLKHNPAAVRQFEDMDGWQRLNGALRDPNITLRRKTAFLINTLLFQDPDAPGTSRQPPTPTPADAPISQATGVAARAPPAAPLERGPETQLTGIPHPDVTKAILASGILRTLLSSLLPPATPGAIEIPGAGPDADAEPRSDLDFAEKATQSIFTFASKLESGTTGRETLPLDADSVQLLAALASNLAGQPLDTTSGFQSRWEELSVDKASFQEFEAKVNTWSS